MRKVSKDSYLSVTFGGCFSNFYFPNPNWAFFPSFGSKCNNLILSYSKLMGKYQCCLSYRISEKKELKCSDNFVNWNQLTLPTLPGMDESPDVKDMIASVATRPWVNIVSWLMCSVINTSIDDKIPSVQIWLTVEHILSTLVAQVSKNFEVRLFLYEF